MSDRPSGADALLQVLQSALSEQYAFQEQIGRGAYSLVFRVVHRSLGRAEALKVFIRVLDEEAASRFLRETRLAARLDHPNIVKIFNFGQAQGIPWYTMQLVDGSSLAEFIKTNGPLDLHVFLQLAIPILDAMAFSHQQGIIHRDIKPQNLLLDRFLRPYVADFGLAKALEEPGLTTTGSVLGTPGFLAPEVLAGQPASFASDIYALGATFYQMLSGHLPFSGREAFELLMACVNSEPTPLLEYRPDLPSELVALIMRALARDPHARPRSVAEMKFVLAAAAGDSAGVSDQGAAAVCVSEEIFTGATVALQPKVRRHFKPLALAMGGFIVALGFVLLRASWTQPEQRLGASPALHITPLPIHTVQPSPSAERAAAPTPSPTPAFSPTPTRRPPALPPPGPPTVLARPPLADRELVVPLGEDVPPECHAVRVPLLVKVSRDGRLLGARPLGHVPGQCARLALALLESVHWSPGLNARGEAMEATFATEVFLAGSPANNKGKEETP